MLRPRFPSLCFSNMRVARPRFYRLSDKGPLYRIPYECKPNPVNQRVPLVPPTRLKYNYERDLTILLPPPGQCKPTAGRTGKPGRNFVQNTAVLFALGGICYAAYRAIRCWSSKSHPRLVKTVILYRTAENTNLY